jgi:uncharacterized cofD-like protein
VRLLPWLYPGIGVKRWLLLFVVALGFLGLGFSFSLSPGTVPALGALLARALRAPAGTTVPRGLEAAVLLAAGAVLAVLSLRAALRSVIEVVAPHAQLALGEILYAHHRRDRGPSIVAVGGGTGLPVLLRGLKEYTRNITALVTVGDDGGSSGRLRGELGILPPGDVRNCLVALADAEPLMAEVFQHRFDRGGLAGHTVGNVLLGGLTEVTGDFVAAVEALSRVLAVRGRVLPSTVHHVTLVAELEDGRIVQGETAIVAARGRIRRLALVPPEAQALPDAVAALEAADIVVLGPGSLYTSVLPNLLLPELRQALHRTRALRFFVVNVMTQPGETDGFTAADHLEALQAHVGRPGVDVVVVHEGPIDPARLAPYREQGAEPVAVDADRLRAMGVEVVARDLVTRSGLVRHDPDRLAAAILEAALERLGRPGARRLLDYYLLQERLRRRREGEAAAAAWRPTADARGHRRPVGVGRG